MCKLRLKPTLITAICLSFSFSLLANDRKFGAEIAYKQTLDSYVQKQIVKTLTQYASVFTNLSSVVFKELEQLSADLQNDLGLWNPGQEAVDYYGYLVAQRNAQYKYSKSSDRISVFKNKITRLKLLFIGLGNESFCETSISAVFENGMPQYQLDESIDLSAVPEPKHFSVRPDVGSEIGSADAVEKGLYLPATSGGCLAGQALIPIPFVGCIIGAVVGAAAAYGTGKGTTAIITATENDKERAEYEHSIAQERARQEKEIEDARSFMKSHPIDADLLTSRTVTACSKQDFSTFSDFLSDINNWIDVIDSVQSELAKEKSIADEHLKQVRAEAADAQTKVNNEAMQNTRRAFFASVADGKEVAAARQIRRTLVSCISDALDSCSEIESCFDEANAALLGKNQTIDILSEKMQNLRNLFSHCNLTGTSHDS